jgi:hypothetical protein
MRSNWLPSLPEQINNLVRWFGDNHLPGEGIQLTAADSQNVIGAETLRGASFVIDYLCRSGLIDGTEGQVMGYNRRVVDAKLSMGGWSRYEELKRGEIKNPRFQSRNILAKIFSAISGLCHEHLYCQCEPCYRQPLF